MADSGLELLQVGHVEVEPGALSGPGESLTSILAGRELEVAAPDEQMGQLPADGWRSICTRSAGQHWAESEVLAAPYLANRIAGR